MRAFLLDDLLDEEGSDGEEVNLICYSFRGLDGSDVGVDEDRVYPLLTHRLECLRARVVELSCFPDLQGSRS